MPKVTANGKTFNFPDGTSTEQMGTAIDEYFADQQSGYQPDIQQEAPAINPADVPHMPGAGYAMQKAQQIRDAQNQKVQAHNDYERSFIGDKERQQIKAEEADRGLLSGIGEGIAHTMKGFNAGTKLSPDWMPSSLQDILDYRIGGDNSKSRDEVKKEIADDMAQHNERYAITQGENPVATMAGEALPYLATGAAGEAALGKVASKMSPRVGNMALDAMEKSGLNPLVAKAQNLRNAPKITSDFAKRSASIAKAPVVGAVEGAANYNDTALKGAVGSSVGALSGAVGPLRKLNSVENIRDANTKATIDEMHRKGFKITPGLKTGNKGMQKEEAGMRNSDTFSDEVYAKVDRPNQRKMTEMAGEAIGLDGRGRDTFSQSELSGHLDNLSSEYKSLEANTIGKFSQDSFARINSAVKNLQPIKNRNQSLAAKQRYATMQDVVSEVRTVLQPFTDTKGKFAVQKFDGSKYQAASQYLKDQISKATTDGDKILGKNLKVVKDELDKSIESGMGKTESKEWRDLNERYAMTNMLMENGLEANGKVNPAGISSAVMSNAEARRTLTGSGGRIKKFQDIARYNATLNDVEGGTLTGLGAEGQTHDRGMLKPGWQYRIPLMGKAKAAVRLSGMPTWGLGPTAAVKTSRAIGMSNPYDNMATPATEAWEDLKAKFNF